MVNLMGIEPVSVDYLERSLTAEENSTGRLLSEIVPQIVP
jgi:hypothetical protein